MNVQSRIRKFERSLKDREWVLYWLNRLLAKGGFSDFWKFGEFESWPSENEELGILYNLVFEVNSAVMLAATRLRDLGSWASLLGIVMLTSTSTPTLPQPPDFVSVWRDKLRKFLVEVVALQQAVELISERYFDGHEVLFVDTRQELASSHELAMRLIHAYNYFAEENENEEGIDIQSIEHCQGRKLRELLNQWSMSARSKALAAQGQSFEARDVVLDWLKANPPAVG